MKGLLTIGLQSLQRYRVRFRVGPPHAQLHEFRVKLPATWELGPWRPPRVTNSIHKKLSRLPISARRPNSTSHARLHGFRVKLPATCESGPGAPPGNQFDLQETVLSFDFSQTATRLLSLPDSDPQTPDASQEVAMGLPLDNTVTPTTLRQLALSTEDVESQEKAAVHSEPSDMEQGQGGSNDACS